MSTPITVITGLGRRAWTAAGAVLAAGALTAGCGAASVSGPTASTASPSAASGSTAPGSTASGTAASGSTASGSTASGSTATGGTATSGPTSGPTTPAAPSAPATPVPTVTGGGSVAAGEPACAGWPAGAPTASLPVSFVPVKVERCVNGAEAIPGKGLWQTATLQRADGDLAELVSALRQPSTERKPGIVCPALAEIPPAVVLISGTGQLLIPRLPVSGCGLTSSRVLLALGALQWQPVSVRLVQQISAPSATASGTPRSLQTVAAGS